MDKWKIDSWVDACALTPVKYFSPTAIQKDLEIGINEVFNRLLILVNDGKLDLLWRIVCPNCFRQFGPYNTNEIPHYIECLECGEEEVTKDMIYPLFSVTSEYKREVLSQKKTVLQGQMLMFLRRMKLQKALH